MRIGELAAATGSSAHTLRFWEHRGLLPDPGRSANGYRDYPLAAVERVTFVRRAQATGLTLDQIRIALDIRDGERWPCPQVAEFVDERLAEIDARMVELARTRSQLAALGSRLGQVRSRLGPPEAAEPVDTHVVCPAVERAP